MTSPGVLLTSRILGKSAKGCMSYDLTSKQTDRQRLMHHIDSYLLKEIFISNFPWGGGGVLFEDLWGKNKKLDIKRQLFPPFLILFYHLLGNYFVIKFIILLQVSQCIQTFFHQCSRPFGLLLQSCGHNRARYSLHLVLVS